MTFAQEGKPLSVSEVCEKTGLNKSHVSKILKVLCDSGLVVRTRQSRKFEVGPSSFLLGAKFVNAHPLSRLALPFMHKLTEETGHSCTLSAIEDHKLFHFLSVEGTTFIDCRWQVGREIPLHTSATGRVLLSFMPRAKAIRLITTTGLPRLTQRTITNLDKFKEKMFETNRRGYAVTRGEGIKGLGAIAVPIFQSETRIIGALGVIFPERLISEGMQERIILKVMFLTARRLSVKLGCGNYPFSVVPNG